jgi:hypothetical protein
MHEKTATLEKWAGICLVQYVGHRYIKHERSLKDTQQMYMRFQIHEPQNKNKWSNLPFSARSDDVKITIQS